MPLESIRLPDLPPPPAPPVRDFILNAESRIQAFLQQRSANPIRHFIPSHYPTVHAALHHLVTAVPLTGNNFCEWGSGFGVVAGLAAIEGLHATGFEIEPDLVHASRQLLADHHLHATIIEGNYLPPGYGLYYDAVGDTRQLLHDHSANPAYHTLGLEPSDFDLIFVYPWPGEAQMVEDLFEATAAHGATLLLYQGPHDISAYRCLA
ncbi:MAG TPA: hypothetical protein PKE55_07425 [Kiritimatiellia bacterium]|nr:hypothetical protein [Kiritimatiellia bacterium]